MPTIVDGDFEWDSHKAEANVAKHGIDFQEAQVVFLDPFAYFANDGSGSDRIANRLERFLYTDGET